MFKHTMERTIKIKIKTNDDGSGCAADCPLLCGNYCDYFRLSVLDKAVREFKRPEVCKNAESE